MSVRLILTGSSARTQLDLLEQLTSSTFPGSGMYMLSRDCLEGPFSTSYTFTKATLCSNLIEVDFPNRL